MKTPAWDILILAGKSYYVTEPWLTLDTHFLCTLLKKCVHLSFSNKITRDGVKFLAELLKQNQTLQILDLNANRIEDDGAIYLSEALALNNRTLQALVFTQLLQRLQV